LLAADRMASLGTLAAGVGHELNNPLMFVMSNLQVAREELGGLGHVELQTALADAADGAERMRKIIRDLRSFSRQDDSPDVEGSPQRAVQLALNMTQATMSAKARILFTPGETGTVRLSEGRLAQVVVNLLANAVQSFGKDRDPATNEVRVGVLARGGDAVIEVVDNGPGIASDIIGRIFDPFFTTKPVGEGTGLGLSLAHSIVTEAGGRFDVESTVGVGTKFTVVLPQRIVKAPAAAVAQVRVLIVDDDDRVKKALAMLLRGKYAVSSAASGEEALALVDKEATFDLILSDVLMPGMNGIELIQRLRDQRRDGPSPRLALMSGGIFDEQMRAQITALGVPPLNKPFDRNDVQRLLAQPERG
jgi:CheY-like chemotaxis protein